MVSSIFFDITPKEFGKLESKLSLKSFGTNEIIFFLMKYASIASLYNQNELIFLKNLYTQLMTYLFLF